MTCTIPPTPVSEWAHPTMVDYIKKWGETSREFLTADENGPSESDQWQMHPYILNCKSVPEAVDRPAAAIW